MVSSKKTNIKMATKKKSPKKNTSTPKSKKSLSFFEWLHGLGIG